MYIVNQLDLLATTFWLQTNSHTELQIFLTLQ